MSIEFEARFSDSPYIESVTWGRTLSAGSPVRPAELHWHMVFSRRDGRLFPLVVGPLTASGVATYGPDAEILWIKFRLGTFMPRLLPREVRDREVELPDASSRSFWLNGSAWQFPSYDNVEAFVHRLVRAEILMCDPLVEAALHDQPAGVAARTVRHRFLQATGLSQGAVRQIRRAHEAADLLRRGTPILDVVYQLGYFDQPHLTRALKQFTGYTPAQLRPIGEPG